MDEVRLDHGRRSAWSLERPRVSVGYDATPLAARAVSWAADYARRHAGSITVVTAWPGVSPAWPEASGDLRRRARLRAAVGARLARVRTAGQVPVRMSTHPETAVGALVEESARSDLLALGTHRSAGRHHRLGGLGVVVRQVVQESRCPVVLVGPSTLEGPVHRCLLVRAWPVEVEDTSLVWAAHLARTDHVPLLIVTRWQVPMPLPGEDPVQLRADVVRRATLAHAQTLRDARAVAGARVRGVVVEGRMADVLPAQGSPADIVVLPQGDIEDVETCVELVRGPVVVVPPASQVPYPLYMSTNAKTIAGQGLTPLLLSTSG